MRVSMPTVTLPMQLSLDLDYVTAKQTFYMDDLINIHNNIKTDHSLVVYFYQWDPSLFHHKKELLHSTLIPPISANKQNIVIWIIFNFKSLWNIDKFSVIETKTIKSSWLSLVWSHPDSSLIIYFFSIGKWYKLKLIVFFHLLQCFGGICRKLLNGINIFHLKYVRSEACAHLVFQVNMVELCSVRHKLSVWSNVK